MSKSTPMLNVSEDDLDSDEDPYANESFENESDQDISEISDGVSNSDDDSDVGPPMAKDSSIFNAARLQARKKPIREALVPFDSSSDEDDVVISQTTVEINTKPMRMEDLDSINSDKLEDESFLDESSKNLEVLMKNFEIDDSDEEDYIESGGETAAIKKVQVTKILIKKDEERTDEIEIKNVEEKIVLNGDREAGKLASKKHSPSMGFQRDKAAAASTSRLSLKEKVDNAEIHDLKYTEVVINKSKGDKAKLHKNIEETGHSMNRNEHRNGEMEVDDLSLDSCDMSETESDSVSENADDTKKYEEPVRSAGGEEQNEDLIKNNKHRHQCQKHRRQVELISSETNEDSDPLSHNIPLHPPKHSHHDIIDQHDEKLKAERRGSQPDIRKHEYRPHSEAHNQDKHHRHKCQYYSQFEDDEQDQRQHYKDSAQMHRRQYEDDEQGNRQRHKDITQEPRRHRRDNDHERHRQNEDEKDQRQHRKNSTQEHRSHNEGNKLARRHYPEDDQDEYSYHAEDAKGEYRHHAEDDKQERRRKHGNGNQEYRHHSVGGQELRLYCEDDEDENRHFVSDHKQDYRPHCEDGNKKPPRHAENGKQKHRHQYEDGGQEHRRHYEDDYYIPREHYEDDKQDYRRDAQVGKEHCRHYEYSKQDHRDSEAGYQKQRRHYEDEGQERYRHHKEGVEVHRRPYENGYQEHRQIRDERAPISKHVSNHDGRLGHRAHPQNSGLSNHRSPQSAIDGLSTVTETENEAEIDFETLNQSSLRYNVSSRTPTSYNSDIAMHINLVKKTPSGKLSKNKSLRKSWSFSNEQMRDIERTNQILLKKILTQKPTYSANPQKAKSNSKVVAQSSSTKLTTAAVNRKKLQRQIDLDNQSLKRRIEAISERRKKL